MESNRVCLKKYISPVKGLLFVTTLFLVIEAVANVGTIGLQQILIDNVLLQGEQHLLWKTILLITLAFLVQVVMFTLGPHFIHLSVAAVTEHVSKDFIQYMYRIPTRTLQKKNREVCASYLF